MERLQPLRILLIKGRLQINLVSDITAYPIQGARISISYTGIPETPLEQLTTDSFRTDPI